MKKTGVTLAEVMSAWEDDAASRGVSFGSQRTHRGYFDNHIGPALGGLTLDKITPRVVQDAKQVWATKVGIGKSTVRQIAGFVRSLLITARRLELYEGRDLVTAHPELFSGPKPRRVVFLEEDQVGQVLSDLKGRDMCTYRMTAIAVYAGLRLNEILQLCPSRISMVKGTFTVKRKMHRESDSIVYFPAHLKPVLQGLLDEKVWGPDEKFFKSLNRDSYQRALATTGINDGVSPKDRVHWVCFHSLRHTFASLAHNRGVDVTTISKMLGHSSPMSTWVYLNSSDRHIKNAILKLETAHSEVRELESIEDLTSYPEGWHDHAIQDKIIMRDHGRCQECGSNTKGRHVHHIDGNTENCEDWNLITLCKPCHQLTIRGQFKEYQDKFTQMLESWGVKRPNK